MGTSHSRDSTRAAKWRAVKVTSAPGRKPPAGKRRAAKPPDERFVRDIVLLALRLRVIYGTALSVELAMRKQHAENDVEFADCLRHGVCAPTADQCGQAESLAKRVGGLIPEALP